MRTNDNFILRDIAGEYVLIPINEAAQDFNGVLHLTETASFIWKMVDECYDIDEIADKVVDEYETKKETAIKDVYGFLWEFYIRGFVYDIPELEKRSKYMEKQANEQ